MHPKKMNYLEKENTSVSERHKDQPNFMPYARLATNIKYIDIGEIYPIAGTLDEGVGEEETGKGNMHLG